MPAVKERLPYWVKIKTSNGFVYGVTDEFSEEAEKYLRKGQCIVSDAIRPIRHLVPIASLHLLLPGQRVVPGRNGMHFQNHNRNGGLT